MQKFLSRKVLWLKYLFCIAKYNTLTFMFFCPFCKCFFHKRFGKSLSLKKFFLRKFLKIAYWQSFFSQNILKNGILFIYWMLTTFSFLLLFNEGTRPKEKNVLDILVIAVIKKTNLWITVTKNFIFTIFLVKFFPHKIY